jgi:hypothetical protein
LTFLTYRPFPSKNVGERFFKANNAWKRLAEGINQAVRKKSAPKNNPSPKIKPVPEIKSVPEIKPAIEIKPVLKISQAVKNQSRRPGEIRKAN